MIRHRRALHLFAPHAHRTYAVSVNPPGGANDRLVVTPVVFPGAVAETITLDGPDSGLVARGSIDSTPSSFSGSITGEQPLDQPLLITRFTGQAPGKWNHDIAAGIPSRHRVSAPAGGDGARLRVIKSGAASTMVYYTVTLRAGMPGDVAISSPWPAPALTPPAPPGPVAPPAPVVPPAPVRPPAVPVGPRPSPFVPPNPWRPPTAAGRRGPAAGRPTAFFAV